MSTFGENLRREREMRGVTLEEIRDATKIGMRALKAMENDQFEKLPGGIFTRSFVRTYAKYLGLDEEKIMAEFQLVAPPSAQQADLNKISQQRTLPAKDRSWAGLITVLVVVLVAAGGYGYYRYAKNAGKSSHPAAPSTAAQTPSTSPGQPAAGSASSSTAVSQSGLVLQIAATETSWVAVSADGKPQGQRTMEPNEIETYHADKSFDVLTGNAEGIILTLNGKTLDPLGRQGETKRVHLTIDDVQNSNP